MGSCRNITDEGIMAFTDKLASLTELNIARTKISEKGLHHIVNYAPGLKKLCKYHYKDSLPNFPFFWIRSRIQSSFLVRTYLLLRTYS
jgi:hypothetical protein